MKTDFGNVNDNYKDYTSIIADKGSETFIKLPNGYTDLNDSDVSCDQLLDGYKKNDATGNNSFEGAFSLAGITPPVATSSTADKYSFLTSMGYSKTTASDGQCATIQYNHKTENGIGPATNSIASVQICASTVNNDRAIGLDKLEIQETIIQQNPE